MDRTGLAIAIGATLLVAAAVGWGLHMLWVRLADTTRMREGRLAVMAERLLAAETGRHAAEEAQAEAEARLLEAEARIAELEAEIAEREAREKRL